MCNFDVKFAFEKANRKKFSSVADCIQEKNLFVSRKQSVASCGSRVYEEFAGAKA